ncbi:MULTISPECIES: hypothetical protein [unclassified Nocardia]|uniref:hypothetical protein n=1 Tax=unclassified Nocardia TaxID=2637762 RepID=UPI001CE3F02B|nr:MULTISPECIES: hypothetical protein [unclassified Nocardia]
MIPTNTNNPVCGDLRNVKYVAASLFRPAEADARVSFLVGGTEIRLTVTDARALSEVLPGLLAEHSVALAFAPLEVA